MARPLPMVSPGDWPAPTMIAVLPAKRPLISESLQIGIEHLAIVKLNAKAVQQHRDLGVLADGEHQIHALAFLIMPGELGPDRFGDELLAKQIVGRPKQDRIGVAPARRVGADLDPVDLLLGQAGTATDRHMLGPLVAGTAKETGAQDDDLALARRQRAFAAQDIPAPNEEGLCRSRMAQQGAEDIENRAAGQHRPDNLALLVGPAFGGDGRYARASQPHVTLQNCLPMKY